MALREELGLSAHSSCMAFGMQLAQYSQLRDAVQFLKENDVTIKYLPPAAVPGIRIFALRNRPGWPRDPALLLHGTDRLGRAAATGGAAPQNNNDNWPESLEPLADSYAGEAFMGPWG